MCCHCTWAKSLKHLSQITKALNNCIAIDTAKLKFHIRYLMCTMYIDVHICDCTLRKTRFNNTRHLIKQHMHSNVIAIAQRLHIRQDPPLQICAESSTERQTRHYTLGTQFTCPSTPGCLKSYGSSYQISNSKNNSNGSTCVRILLTITFLLTTENTWKPMITNAQNTYLKQYHIIQITLHNIWHNIYIQCYSSLHHKNHNNTYIPYYRSYI